jgi:hypothetical protein
MCSDGTRLNDIGLNVEVTQTFIDNYQTEAPDLMLFPPGDFAQAPDLSCMSLFALLLISFCRYCWLVL